MFLRRDFLVGKGYKEEVGEVNKEEEQKRDATKKTNEVLGAPEKGERESGGEGSGGKERKAAG